MVWVLQAFGVGYDTVWHLTGDRLARNSGDVGVYVDTAWGEANLILQIIWAIENGWDDKKAIAMAFLGTIPEFFKFLRHTSVVAVSDGLSLVALAAIDLVGSESVAAVNFSTLGDGD